MKTLFTLLLSIIALASLQAQSIERELVSNSGQETEQISWSVGQTSNSTYEEGDIILNEGYQQGYYSISQKVEESAHNLLIEVYPNPVRDQLYINIPHSDKSYAIEMYNAKGSKVFEQKNVSHLVQIRMSQYAISTYYLKIYENKKLISTYKLIREK